MKGMRKMGEVLMILSWIFFIFGVIGIFKFKNFYARIMTSSKIDSATAILLLVALSIYSHDWYYASRYLIILIFILITNPVTTHLIARKKYMETKDDIN
jgi:multicomponent Na+:H+ antiporter subunit G